MSVRNIRSAAEMIVYSRGSDAAKRYIASDEFKKLKTRVMASPTRVEHAVAVAAGEHPALSNPGIFDLVLVTKSAARPTLAARPATLPPGRLSLAPSAKSLAPARAA